MIVRQPLLPLALAFFLCPGVCTAVSHAPPPAEKPLTLTAGKFGRALDARASQVVIPGDDRFRKAPLTVECWARLFNRNSFNVLVASDPKSSANHWEIYSYAGKGDFSAYLPGMAPSEIRSGVEICDGQWHYLAMVHDGKTVALFVDGKEAVRQAVKRNAGLKPRPGPLTVGVTLFGADDKERIGCDGLIDDVRLSNTPRRIEGVPTGPLPEDPETIAVWRFDRPEDLTGAQAWTPPPQGEGAAPWEKETDKDWVDGRFRQMDTGPFLGATVDYPLGNGTARCYRATAIKVGAHGEGTVVFDRGQLRWAAAWTGGFLKHSDRRFGLLNTPTPAGKILFSTRSGSGWADHNGKWDERSDGMAPLPAAWGKYRGLYLHGRRTVLSYTVNGVEVLDSPWAESKEGVTVFMRTLEIAPSTQLLSFLVCDLPDEEWGSKEVEGRILALGAKEGAMLVAGVSDANDRIHLVKGSRAEFSVRPHKGTVRATVGIIRGSLTNLVHFLDHGAKRIKALEDVRPWSRPGPARWTTPITTRGVVARDDAPYVIDTLTVPYDNPHKALMFCSGLDFLPNGDLAVCTAHGDVWLVKGVDDKLDKLTWKRFATGLYQPLGLKVVDGKIHVLERGQLTRLHDLNGDGEADFYECVNNDWYVGGGEHSFDCCLETDPKGNFYFFKTGDAHTPTGGCLLRISKDGRKTDVFATGFRQPICLAVSPDGILTGSDQEGNWMPATRIDQYREGGFYGDMRTHHRAVPPATYDPPLCWLPRQADNSSGGELWVPPGKLGPLGGRLLHLSYGRCRALLVLKQQIEGQVQGGAVDLGWQFLAGVMRGRVGPHDGHLYVCGLRGWQTAAVRDGCLQRVRYTGQKVSLPIGLEIFADGIKVAFTCPLDRATAQDIKRYRVQQWGYHWGPEYGSKRWSVAHPDKVGQDAVPVQSVQILSDGRSVFLRIAGLRPAMQMEIDYRLMSAEGQPVRGVIYNTIHRTGQHFGTGL
jgi:hypothetical protein